MLLVAAEVEAVFAVVAPSVESSVASCDDDPAVTVTSIHTGLRIPTIFIHSLRLLVEDDDVVAVEPAVTDGESEAATDMLPSTEFDEIVSVEAIDIC